MTLADYSTGAFAILNGARVFAYVPQIMCVHRDQNGAAAVSVATWTLFTMANIATVSYALAISGDILVAGVFSLNALGCFSIVAQIAIKRIKSGRDNVSAATIVAQIVRSGRRGMKAVLKRVVRLKLRNATRRLNLQLFLTLPSGSRFQFGDQRSSQPEQSKTSEFADRQASHQIAGAEDRFS